MSPTRDTDYSQIPDSPHHPDPDTEVQLPEQNLNSNELDFLDLNPDIEEVAPDVKEPEHKSIFDNREDFKPVITQSPLNPNGLRPGRLSAVQQTRFNAYVEEQLHSIQRRFIQSLGLGESGYNNSIELLKDVKNVINFVWLSIEPVQEDSSLPYSQQTSTLFGQSNYLVSIANDLLEYLVKFPLTHESAPLLLKVLQSLDIKFTKLIDGEIPGGTKLQGTERVRLHAIAERSRLFVASYFERNGIEGFHYELGRIYEGVLDRTG